MLSVLLGDLRDLTGSYLIRLTSISDLYFGGGAAVQGQV